MYKVLTSLWSKPTTTNKIQLSLNDDDSWVFVSNTAMESSLTKSNHLMTNSWIASPPLIKNDDLSTNIHHLNPIENLLIEHASMSVYEQIASKTRNKRERKIVNSNNKLNEQTEEIGEELDDDDDDKGPMNHQHPNLTSTHHRALNISSNSSTTTLDSSTSSLMVHHRHLQRLHQRRKRTNKSSSKLILTNNMDESKQGLNKNLERQRSNHARTPKTPLQQSSRLNH